jgi:hypothetical protein
MKWKIYPSESETAQPTGNAAYRLILPRRLLEKYEESIALVPEVWIDRWDAFGGYIISYPVHNRELLNVVLIYPDDDQTEDSWRSTTEKRHVVTAFREWNLVLQVGLFWFRLPSSDGLTGECIGISNTQELLDKFLSSALSSGNANSEISIRRS